jgi:hypothetical protein
VRAQADVHLWPACQQHIRPNLVDRGKLGDVRIKPNIVNYMRMICPLIDIEEQVYESPLWPDDYDAFMKVPEPDRVCMVYRIPEFHSLDLSAFVGDESESDDEDEAE